MRNYLLALVGAWVLASCTDYLDVKPKSLVEKDVLFETEDGFTESLLGVYARCTQEDAYGDELSFGLLDVLTQNYTIIGTSSQNTLQSDYSQIIKYNYKDAKFIEKKDKVWASLYAAISNCNVLLATIDAKKNVFKTAATYRMIKGEALALRAYLHFDLLRLFASASLPNSAAGIPYVTTFSNQITPMSSPAQVLNFVVADLSEAKALLKDSDPITTGGYLVGYPNQPEKVYTEESSASLFMQNRRHRLNYYAVCGALARVYLYQGDQPKALENALVVIHSNIFPWTDKKDFTADNDETKDRILYKELLFGWFIPKRDGRLNDRFQKENSSTSIALEEGNSLFEVGGVGAEDFRFKQWLKERSDGFTNRLYVEKYTRDGDRNLHPLMAPALRLSEMYYIAAECTFDTDPEKAWQYYNTVRFNRGIGAEVHNQPSKETFITELLKEYRKEFYAEGQLFYAYKRLNRNIQGQNGTVIRASDAIFVMPMPDDEIQFGQRK